ncbi:MAG TPA: hypothetical protein VI732_06380 [Alphaproteobacteria bacterium]|nr:hypothetical protein [Alphaproteobacteria bacterium]
MATQLKAKPSRKFTRNHQLAILLIRHLGADGAVKACYNNQWYAVLSAIEEQKHERAEARAVN